MHGKLFILIAKYWICATGHCELKIVEKANLYVGKFNENPVPNDEKQ